MARAVPVTLRIVDSADKPVAGASVQYVETPADITETDDEYVLPPTPTAHAATAGDDGVVTLDLPDVTLDDAARKRMAMLAARTKKDADLTPVLARARVRRPGLASEDVALHAGENSVKLKPGAQMSGLVSDDKGAPIAGAQVKLEQVIDKENQESGFFYFDTTGFDAIAATTGADGRWVLDELPHSGVASLQARAPGRVTAGFRAWLEGVQNPAPTQKLEAGGTVSGRLLGRNGEPIAGAQVYRSNAFDRVNRSDKDGRFRLEGVAVGAHQIQIFGGANWFGRDEPITATVKEGGQNVDLGDLVSGEGTLISGTVVDKTSRKPLAGLELRLVNKKLKTDAQGRFEGRSNGSYLQLQVVGDYVSSADSFRPIPAKSATYDAGEIAVERAVSLPLDVRDEKGEAVLETSVLFAGKTDQQYARFDGESMEIGPIAAGDYQLKGYGSWEVIEPKKASVPAFVEGEKPKTLAIQVRRVPQQKIAGRVVDAKGAPLANVAVGVKLSGDEYRFQPLSALSRRDGSWELEFSPVSANNNRNKDTPVEPSIDKVKSASYAQLRGGEVTRQNDNWRATDIVMARADATLEGRVVNANGAPISGASLSWTGAKTGEFARTDAEGHFTLTGLPDAPLQLRVSDGPNLLETRELTPGEITDITLPAAVANAARAQALWQQESANGISNLDEYYEALGAPRLLEAALRADAAKVKPEDANKIGSNLDAYLQMLVRHQPEIAVAQGVELVGDKDLKGDKAGVAALALAAARSNDEGARAFANRWFDAQKDAFSMQQEGNAAVTSALKLAAVGTRLGRNEAASYRDLALVWSDRVKDDNRVYYLDDWGALLWAGGPQFYEEAVAEWPALDRLLSLSGAIKGVESVEQGRALLARLETLAKDPEVAKADAARAEKQRYSESMRDRALQNGRSNFARALATIDPAAALDEMDKIENAYAIQDVAVQIASDSIAKNRPELARRALKIGLKDSYINRPGTSAMAILARDFDAKLADELLSATRQSVLPKEENRFGGQDYQSVSNYAVALRDVEPGTGRLLLESEWARREAQKPDPNNRWTRENALRELTRAMAVYDVERALEWAQKAGDGNGNSGTNLRASVVAAALATPGTRPLMMVREYGG